MYNTTKTGRLPEVTNT